MKKLYIVQKYVMAKSAKEAIDHELSCAVDNVWLDEEWKAENKPNKKVGFHTNAINRRTKKTT